MAKKVVKPSKKVVKKPAPKSGSKTVSKPAAKPVAKNVAKKVATKSVAKAASKKAVSKPTTKSAPKKVAVKTTKTVVKVTAKPVVKVTAKVAPKTVAKAAAKPVAKPAAKPVVKTTSKPTQGQLARPVSKRQETSIDLDDDNGLGQDLGSEKSNVFFYEPPKAFIKRPDLMEPKPFIGSDERKRYSDKELAEFKELILSKLEEAKRDYELLKNTLSHKDDHGTDDTSPTFKLLEDGSDVMSKEETSALAGRQEKYIQNLQNALIRIENKSYGICRITSRLIPKERLRSVPHATTSIEGKMQQYS